jgi:hypothetical protein
MSTSLQKVGDRLWSFISTTTQTGPRVARLRVSITELDKPPP